MNAWSGRQIPRERIFGKTHDELNEELWRGDRLKPGVRKALLERLNGVMKTFDQNWHQWSRAYFAGSMASLWWGNNDLDILVGVDYDKARESVEEWQAYEDKEISDALNKKFRADFNNSEYDAPWNDEKYELTAYNNLNSYDIRDIRPYAAYEMLENMWYVRPPHLPHWSPADFPQGTGLWSYINGMANAIKGVLEMPDPYGPRQAAALWDFLHSDRKNAFGEEGQGWYDTSNVIEKYLDQIGLWGQLLQAKKRYDSGDYNKGEEWSNVPHTASLTKQGCMVAIKPPLEDIAPLLPKRRPEALDDLHMTLVCLEDGHDQGHLEELPEVVAEWAQSIDPITLTVNGIGTFVNGDEHVLWAGVDHPDLNRIQESLAMWLAEHDYKIKENFSYKPHITLGYSPNHVRFLPKLHQQISFDTSEVEVHLSESGQPKNIKCVKMGGS